MPAATQASLFNLASLSGTYSYKLTGVPNGVEMGTVTFDGAGNLDSTDIAHPNEVRKSAVNGTDYTVSPTGGGSLKIMFHAEGGKSIGPWFNYIGYNGLQSLWVTSTDGSGITGELQKQ